MNLQNTKYKSYYDDITKNNNYNEWFIPWDLTKDVYVVFYVFVFFSKSFIR